MTTLSSEHLKLISYWGVAIAAIAAGIAAVAGFVAGYAGIELGRQSDRTIVEVQAATKAADARAAEANVKALELQLQLEKLRTNVGGREIQESQAEVILKHIKGKYKRIGLVQQDDAESGMYLSSWVDLIQVRGGIPVVSRTVSEGAVTQDGSSKVFLVLPKTLSESALHAEPLFQALSESSLLAGVYYDEHRTEHVFDFPYLEIPARATPPGSHLGAH